MAKLSLNTITSGFNVNKINENFSRILDTLQNKVLYRNNPVGEPNQLITDVDVNGKALYNLPEPSSDNQAARLKDVRDALNGTTGLVPFPASLIPATDGAGGTLWTTVQQFINRIISSAGSSVVGFIHSIAGSVFRTVQSKLRDSISVKDFGAVGDGVADDTAAFQLALNSAGVYRTVLVPEGVYRITGQLNHTEKIRILVRGEINYTATSGRLFNCIPTGGDGFPGYISYEGLKATGPGTGTAECIHVDANSPTVVIKDFRIENFDSGIYLRNCYCSRIMDGRITGGRFGWRLMKESHASTIQNVLVEYFTVVGGSVNYGSAPTETGPTHNITLLGCASQRGPLGFSFEQCLEPHLVNSYFELNTLADIQIGVGDAGAYGRACYNVIVDGFHSSSACSGPNVLIQHSVGVDIRGIAWNSGVSTTNTLLSVDGFSDRVDLGIFRYTTTVPTDTAPINATSDPTRTSIRYNGSLYFGSGKTNAIRFGTLATLLGGIYQGFTPGGRQATTVRSYIQDLQIRAPDVIRLQDASGTDGFTLDNLNNRVNLNKFVFLANQTLGTTVGAAGGASALPATPVTYLVINVNGTDRKIPLYNT